MGAVVVFQGRANGTACAVYNQISLSLFLFVLLKPFSCVETNTKNYGLLLYLKLVWVDVGYVSKKGENMESIIT